MVVSRKIDARSTFSDKVSVKNRWKRIPRLLQASVEENRRVAQRRSLQRAHGDPSHLRWVTVWALRALSLGQRHASFMKIANYAARKEMPSRLTQLLLEVNCNVTTPSFAT
jgi:hypothetical protein